MLMIKVDDNLWEAKIYTNKYFNHKKLKRFKNPILYTITKNVLFL